MHSWPDDEGITHRMMVKQLYLDREEVTVFLTRTKHWPEPVRIFDLKST